MNQSEMAVAAAPKPPGSISSAVSRFSHLEGNVQDLCEMVHSVLSPIVSDPSPSVKQNADSDIGGSDIGRDLHSSASNLEHMVAQLRDYISRVDL